MQWPSTENPSVRTHVAILEKMRLFGFALFLLVTMCSSLAVEETVNAVQVKCGKVKFKCAMTFTFENKCSQIATVVPRCTPKNKKCTKGVSFVTKSGCTVSGTFKSTGKKQTFTQIKVSPPPLEETVDVGQVQCGKVIYQQCEMEVTYKEDCSKVSKVVPNCSPKKSKCMKGVSISFATEKGCTVNGMYKNTGKKQTMSKLAISTTTQAPTTVRPTTVPACSGGPVEWSDWGEWSTCNSSSPHIRLRNCMNSPTFSACQGEPIETAPCTQEPIHNTTGSGELSTRVSQPNMFF